MKPLPKGLLIGGLVLFLGAPMAGFLLTVLGMVGAFNTLGQNGISDPKLLSAHIGTVLTATFAGLVVGAIGLLIVVLAAILHFATRPVPPTPTR